MQDLTRYQHSLMQEARTWTTPQLREAIQLELTAARDPMLCANTQSRAKLVAQTYETILKGRANTRR